MNLPVVEITALLCGIIFESEFGLNGISESSDAVAECTVVVSASSESSMRVVLTV